MNKYKRLFIAYTFAALVAVAGATGAYSAPLDLVDNPNLTVNITGKSASVQYQVFDDVAGKWNSVTVNLTEGMSEFPGLFGFVVVDDEPAATVEGFLVFSNSLALFSGDGALLFDGRGLAGRTGCVFVIPLDGDAEIADAAGNVSGTGNVLRLDCAADVNVKGKEDELTGLVSGVIKLKIAGAYGEIVHYTAGVPNYAVHSSVKVKISPLKFNEVDFGGPVVR